MGCVILVNSLFGDRENSCKLFNAIGIDMFFTRYDYWEVL